MNFKKIMTGILAISSLFLVINCSSSTEVDNTARVQLKLVDAPGDYLGVNVEIIDIQYNSDSEEEGWTSFNPATSYPIQVDLTDLTAGNNLLLTDDLLPAGNLHQIRLILSENNTLEIEGDTPDNIIVKHLSTPSAQQSGLKLKLDQELVGGFTYSFILDWDVQQSVVKAGNSDKYNLKPVIRVIATASSGSIQGNVTADIQTDDVENAPLYNATIGIYDSNDSMVAQTMSNENGEYMLYGVPPGHYYLKISHQLYQEYASVDSIEIVAGEIFNYESIELALLIP